MLKGICTPRELGSAPAVSDNGDCNRINWFTPPVRSNTLKPSCAFLNRWSHSSRIISKRLQTASAFRFIGRRLIRLTGDSRSQVQPFADWVLYAVNWISASCLVAEGDPDAQMMDFAVAKELANYDSQSVVRHLASSRTGRRIAVGEFEKHVSIWDVISRTRVQRFITCLDFGGARLAISPDGELCAAGSFRESVISCYEVETGMERWHRLDIHKPQRISFSAKGPTITVVTDDKELYTLSTADGKTIGVRGHTRSILESSWEPYVLVSSERLGIKRQELLLHVIPRETFCELAAEFLPGQLCVSESTGKVRCFEIESGQEQWSYADEGRHVTELQYSQSCDALFAVDFAYQTEGVRRLLRLNRRNGKVSVVAKLKSGYASAFCLDATKLVTAGGEIMETSTGLITGKLCLNNEK